MNKGDDKFRFFDLNEITNLIASCKRFGLSDEFEKLVESIKRKDILLLTKQYKRCVKVKLLNSPRLNNKLTISELDKYESRLYEMKKSSKVIKETKQFSDELDKTLKLVQDLVVKKDHEALAFDKMKQEYEAIKSKLLMIISEVNDFIEMGVNPTNKDEEEYDESGVQEFISTKTGLMQIK